MKVYFRGLNIHHWLPSTHKLIGEFMSHDYKDLRQIEVSYYFSVLLVADVVHIKGAKTQNFELKDVKQVSCNENKILILFKNGDLFKINEENQITQVPKVIDMTDGDCITSIAQGSKLTIILTQKGHIYNFPNKLDFQSNKIIDFKAGREHCILLDNQGKVYTFGRGSRGQLGHSSLEDEPEPKFVEALGGIEIKGVAAGSWHSCALSRQGDVYLWGWNGNGQLGVGPEAVSVLATPTVLDFRMDVEGMGCGARHTVIFTEQGAVYGCGWNKYKQLKNEQEEKFDEMCFLGKFEGVRDVKCGPWNTIVVCV